MEQNQYPSPVSENITKSLDPAITEFRPTFIDFDAATAEEYDSKSVGSQESDSSSSSELSTINNSELVEPTIQKDGVRVLDLTNLAAGISAKPEGISRWNKWPGLEKRKPATDNAESKSITSVPQALNPSMVAPAKLVKPKHPAKNAAPRVLHVVNLATYDFHVIPFSAELFPNSGNYSFTDMLDHLGNMGWVGRKTLTLFLKIRMKEDRKKYIVGWLYYHSKFPNAIPGHSGTTLFVELVEV
ncbi:hypothetical protein BJ508DRAFT_307743 [Ascobolus immersus RN42]|uniref:Uncharacterized protein n=1 Tax=Ascobolus immersus RN42 TaxID=1160509 RepID=A0A3N4IE74_ASCIM|nr:hypothetical protein BJ508DRAFT_307743 [Ascobolus immersus RN42]